MFIFALSSIFQIIAVNVLYFLNESSDPNLSLKLYFWCICIHTLTLHITRNGYSNHTKPEGYYSISSCDVLSKQQFWYAKLFKNGFLFFLTKSLHNSRLLLSESILINFPLWILNFHPIFRLNWIKIILRKDFLKVWIPGLKCNQAKCYVLTYLKSYM